MRLGSSGYDRLQLDFRLSMSMSQRQGLHNEPLAAAADGELARPYEHDQRLRESRRARVAYPMLGYTN